MTKTSEPYPISPKTVKILQTYFRHKFWVQSRTDPHGGGYVVDVHRRTCQCLWYEKTQTECWHLQRADQYKKEKRNRTMTTIKTIMAALTIAVAVNAEAADKKPRQVRYEFTEINEPRLISINRFDEKASVTQADSTGFRAIYTDRKGVKTEFECGLIQPASLGDTMPSKINSQGQITGSCIAGDFNVRTGVSFIRERGGAMTIVQYPGADFTDLFGLNNRGQGVGQVYMPFANYNQSGYYRVHGFVYDKGKMTLLDIPGAPAGLLRVTTFFGADDAGRMIGQYIDVDPTNNEWHGQVFFLYDNGQVLDLKVPGSAWTDVQDINGLGQIIGNSDKGAFLWDDGQFYVIPPPQGKAITSVESIDDDGRIVGFYRQFPCPVQTSPGNPPCPSAQFIATPATIHKFVDMRGDQ